MWVLIDSSYAYYRHTTDRQTTHGRAIAYTERWRRGVVASVVRRMNEVTLRRARLLLGWVPHMAREFQ